MSVLIKGMEMPKHCLECPCRDIDDDCVLQSAEMNASSDTWEGQKVNCPLVYVTDKLLEENI